ncbi:hypothetical protein K3551_09340 [Jannaschia sp. M317]|nr:hypothetical protein K3551_09340 [Jannaschia sp. M317]
MPWERRRWLNSDMGLRGDWVCKAMYFDLINHAYDQSPIGTLPQDMATLARLLRADRTQFEDLVKLPLGPLHRWHPCRCDGEVRLMHDTVLRSLTEGFARREDNRARTDAANSAKRIQRLRISLAGLDKALAENDHAVRWIDEWLIEEGCVKRVASWIEKGVRAWVRHRQNIGGSRDRR